MRDLPEAGGPVINSDSAKDQDSVQVILPVAQAANAHHEWKTALCFPSVHIRVNSCRPGYLPVVPAPSVSWGARSFIIFSNLTRCSAFKSCMMRVFPEARKSSSWS